MRGRPIKTITDSAGPAGEDASLSAPEQRRRALLIWAVLLLMAGAFGLLTYLVKTNPSFATDLQITQSVQLIRHPAFAWCISLVSWPGFTPQVVIGAGLITLWLVGLGLRWEAVAALAAALASTALNGLVKDLIQRPRPLPSQVNVVAALTSYSFPSGHVMFYVTFFGFLGFLALCLLQPSPKRTVLLVLLGGLIAFIGLSRIYLGEHWASDVLGSYLLGSLLLAAIIQFYLWGKVRFVSK